MNATADFINGFIYGMTGDTSITPEQLEECYVAPKPDLLDKELTSGISLLRKGTFVSEVASGAAFLTFVKHFPVALTTCQISSLPHDLDLISNWTLALNDPETLGKTVTENYMQYKDQVDTDTHYILIYWDS